MKPAPWFASSFALWFVLAFVVTSACTGPRFPAGDYLGALRFALDAAEVTMPFARKACDELKAPAERARCHTTLSGTDAAMADASRVLATADGCRQAADEACLQRCSDDAIAILPKLRRLIGTPAPASASASTPAPETPHAH